MNVCLCRKLQGAVSMLQDFHDEKAVRLLREVTQLRWTQLKNVQGRQDSNVVSERVVHRLSHTKRAREALGSWWLFATTSTPLQDAGWLFLL